MPHRPNVSSIAGSLKLDSRLTRNAFATTSKEKMHSRVPPPSNPPLAGPPVAPHQWPPPPYFVGPPVASPHEDLRRLRLSFAQVLNVSDRGRSGPLLPRSASGMPSFSPTDSKFFPGFRLGAPARHFHTTQCFGPVFPSFRQLGTAAPGMEPEGSDEPTTPMAKRARMDYRRSSYASATYPFVGRSRYLPAEEEEEARAHRRSESCGRSERERQPLELSERDLLSRVQRLRKWDLTDCGREHSRRRMPGLDFTVLTYNVLAQCLLEANGYLYTHCDPAVLRWDYRKKRILKELERSNADVLCLQEIQSEHFKDFFIPELGKLGYAGLYKKRTGDKNDGCAVFYRDDRFALDASASVEYSKPGLSGCDRARDNIALLVMLRPRGEGRSGSGKVCVANTHLLFNPGRGDIKLAQLKILLAEIDRFAYRRLSQAQKPLYHPVLMCGDMNSEPNCSLYEFVSTGALRYEGLVAGDISGQAEGYRKGRFCLEKELVPEQLGISDQCQYVETVSGRMGNAVTPRAEGNAGLEAAEEAGCGQGTALEAAASASTSSERRPSAFSTGRMSHRLNFVSAYGHSLRRSKGEPPAVTTHLRKNSCMVDYIFYSVHSKRSRVRRNAYGQRVEHSDTKEGLLSLLATYGLLSSEELTQLGGLPNGALPSDHLPLIARFLLRDS